MGLGLAQAVRYHWNGFRDEWNAGDIAECRAARERGFVVENQGDLGLSMRTDELSVSFMRRGSAVVVGPRDEAEAVSLYKGLLGTGA